MNANTKDDNLLTHLAWKLSSRHEDIAVEALGFILRSASARRVLVELAREGGADPGEIASVLTQVGGQEQTRPDLVCYDQKGNESLIIEAKFWAGLTSNQPNAYLKRLPEQKVLLFVAPTSRLETLWNELCRLAGIDNKQSAYVKTEFKGTRTNTEVSGDKHLMLISWTSLLDRMENSSDSDMQNEIGQLAGFVRRIDESGFPPLSMNELAPEIPRRIRGFRQLVDDATDRAVDEGHLDIEGLKITPQYRGYGRYVRVKGAGAWFGIDSNRWANGSYPDTPIWLQFTQWDENNSIPLARTRRALKPFTRSDPRECYDEDDAIVVPFSLPVGVEYESVLESVVCKIQQVAKMIQEVNETAE